MHIRHIDTEAFVAGRPGGPFARAESLFEAILGQRARLPSRRRFQARDQAERQDIPLIAGEIELLNRLSGAPA
ncbi:hypothetical protein ACXIUS_09765 [Bosea thiooxidans]